VDARQKVAGPFVVVRRFLLWKMNLFSNKWAILILFIIYSFIN
jgi:hypothetical protein